MRWHRKRQDYVKKVAGHLGDPSATSKAFVDTLDCLTNSDPQKRDALFDSMAELNRYRDVRRSLAGAVDGSGRVDPRGLEDYLKTLSSRAVKVEEKYDNRTTFTRYLSYAPLLAGAAAGLAAYGASVLTGRGEVAPSDAVLAGSAAALLTALPPFAGEIKAQKGKDRGNYGKPYPSSLGNFEGLDELLPEGYPCSRADVFSGLKEAYSRMT